MQSSAITRLPRSIHQATAGEYSVSEHTLQELVGGAKTYPSPVPTEYWKSSVATNALQVCSGSLHKQVPLLCSVLLCGYGHEEAR